VAQKPAVAYWVQNRRSLSRRNLSPLHLSLALSASFKICSAPKERVLRAVITLRRSGNFSLRTLLRQKHETLLSKQSLPVSELKEKQVTCRAKLLGARIAPSSDLFLEISPNTRALLPKLHAAPRPVFHETFRDQVR
jgi:hypothetical protein